MRGEKKKENFAFKRQLWGSWQRVPRTYGVFFLPCHTIPTTPCLAVNHTTLSYTNIYFSEIM
ncbi:hypothetical protein G9C98_005811 [Cotesia typhae]|uniref:Uncharacterized protein n=1 Tax=Cotesia typhae TaxID=2053667 RepID=A0A8J5QZ19_9HYME|nr:hypothetical protein G9C98_005811 [Cotesia typhae]